MCKQIIGDDKKCKQISGNFDHHADVVVQCGAHPPMERIRGFMRSHWMWSSGECPRRIVPAAAMVDDFEKKRKNTNKTQLLPSFLMVDQRKKAIKTLAPPGTLYSRPWRN
jgi:hypothetical protein